MMKQNTLSRILVGVFALTSGAIVGVARPQQPAAATTIAHVEVARAGAKTIVKVEANGPLSFHPMRLSGPERLALDFAGTRLALAQPSIPSALPPVHSVRAGQFRPGVARIVIDLETAAPYRIISEGNGVTVEFEAEGISPASTPAALQKPSAKERNATLARAEPAAPSPVAAARSTQMSGPEPDGASISTHHPDGPIAPNQHANTESGPEPGSNTPASQQRKISQSKEPENPEKPERSIASQEMQTSQPKKPEKPPRPPIEGSMVGYIDNAIIGSQVRLRFDAAFDNSFPDRAEFFYAKCGCYRAVGLDPNAPGPPPGSAASAIPKNLNFQQLYFYGELAPIKRFSLFTEIPVRWIRAQDLAVSINGGTFPDEGGLSDVQAGFKLALLASSHHYLTIQFRAYFPSGDALRGLGTNHYSVQPELMYYQRLSDRWALETQLSDWHPIGGSAGVPVTSSQGFAGDVFSYGIGPSYQLYRGERVRVASVVELVGWNVLNGFQTPPDTTPPNASGTNIVNMKAGFRILIGAHDSIYLGFGHALTHETWYRGMGRVEYRYTF